MLENEARFERIKDPRRCWAPAGLQPEVPVQIVRDYNYLFGAVSPPRRGSERLDSARSQRRNDVALFLAEVAERHPEDYILMMLQGAGRHRAQDLSIPLRQRPGRPPKLARRRLSQLPRWARAKG